MDFPPQTLPIVADHCNDPPPGGIRDCAEYSKLGIKTGVFKTACSYSYLLGARTPTRSGSVVVHRGWTPWA